MNDFFGDVERLRLPDQQPFGQSKAITKGIKVPRKPPKIKGEFLKGPIPLAWLSVAAKLPGKAPLAVALAIMFEVGRRRASKITLTTAILHRFGVNRKAKYRGLQKLERANLISLVRVPRRNPVVTVLDQNTAPGACPG